MAVDQGLPCHGWAAGPGESPEPSLNVGAPEVYHKGPGCKGGAPGPGARRLPPSSPGNLGAFLTQARNLLLGKEGLGHKDQGLGLRLRLINCAEGTLPNPRVSPPLGLRDPRINMLRLRQVGIPRARSEALFLEVMSCILHGSGTIWCLLSHSEHFEGSKLVR